VSHRASAIGEVGESNISFGFFGWLRKVRVDGKTALKLNESDQHPSKRRLFYGGCNVYGKKRYEISEARGLTVTFERDGDSGRCLLMLVAQTIRNAIYNTHVKVLVATDEWMPSPTLQTSRALTHG